MRDQISPLSPSSSSQQQLPELASSWGFCLLLALLLSALSPAAQAADCLLLTEPPRPSSPQRQQQEHRPSSEPRLGYLVRTVVLADGERVPDLLLPGIYCFSPQKFRSARERRAYSRLVRDVCKAYPYAKLVSSTLIETYEYLETLPDDKSRMRHLKRMEKELYREYFPELKKLTFRQGKIVLKLISRECNSTSFQLIDAYLGGFAANFWNLFAKLFGASLKTEYHPDGADRSIEDICLMIETGRYSVARLSPRSQR